MPNIQKPGGRTNEGQLVLTNGMNVGGRLGTPGAPGTVDPLAKLYNVSPGQGLRLQIANSATTRYFRLKLTQDDGTPVNLVRVGGEGGLLNTAVVEGDVISGFNTKYDSGEILLPPASRADVVVSIPTTATGVLTLWTRDYERMGGNFSQIPTVPVAHFNVTGAVVPAFSLADGDPILDSVGASITAIPGPFVSLKDPATFSPSKLGMSANQIELSNTPGPSIDGVAGSFGGFAKYTDVLHITTSRYGEAGTQLELEITNSTGTHHPFHLHGFSVQPIRLQHPSQPDYVWPYIEYRDTIDVPADYTLVCRLDLAPRVLNDEVTLGGELGRWLFHCHIFFHAHRGMLSEFVVTDANGKEKPNVDVGGSWAYTPLLGVAERRGTFAHPDGDTVTLAATLANGTPIGTVTDVGGGRWNWQFDTAVGPEPADTKYVYITATDSLGKKDQTVFRLKIGAPDDGADNGDPHIHTVDGQRYDFQGVGEFVLLRDREGMEVQARQTPVVTANPITDPYSGLRACVSLNTAVALRVGNHRIAYQPSEQAGELQFFVDGKPTRLASMNVDGHLISSFDAEGSPGLRVDYAHGPIVMVTPRFWNSHGLWYMNIAVSHTQANEGLMGPIAKGSWLPRLRNGATVEPLPRALSERYVALYRVFADSWRVTDEDSLFVYASGTSTATFTDRDWPAQEPPCVLKPPFVLPGVAVPAGVSVAQAEQICSAVTDGGLNKDCVFDVATTGEEEFARGYEFAQKLKASATSVRLVGDHRCEDGSIGVLAIVLPLVEGGATPKGSVVFTIDGEQGPTLPLDAKGRACLPLDKLGDGEHEVQVEFHGDDGEDYLPAKSPALVQSGRPKAPDESIFKRYWYWLILLLLLLLLVFRLL